MFANRLCFNEANLLAAAPTCIFHVGKLESIPSAKLAHL